MIDLAGLRHNRSFACRAAAHTGSYHRYRLRAILPHVAYRSQNVQVERSTHGVGLAWPSGLTVAAEVDRQHAKSRRCQGFRLLLPAPFVETASMSQYNAAVACSV